MRRCAMLPVALAGQTRGLVNGGWRAALTSPAAGCRQMMVALLAFWMALYLSVSGWDELGLVEQAQPGAVGLPASHLCPGARAVLRRGGGEGDAAADQCRQRWLRLEVWRVRQHFLPQRTDSVAAHRLAAGGVGHDGLLFVERCDTGCIAVVGALDEQAGEVFRLHGSLVVRHRGPSIQS